MSPFEAIIFDLDGTLADTIDDIADAMNASLAKLGQPTHPREAYKGLVGEGVVNLAERALPVSRHDLIDEAVAGFRAHYSHHIVDHTRPFPEVPALLDALTERRMKMAILSNKIDAMTKRIADLCFAKWPFAHILGERPNVPRKPDPTAALELAGLLGVDPARTLFVGDTAIDMKTSVNAGMYGVGVLWGFRGREEMEAAGARRIIASPLELLNVL